MKVCEVCGAQEGKDCVEVFGLIAGIETGCNACIGVTHFPDHDEIARKLSAQTGTRKGKEKR